MGDPSYVADVRATVWAVALDRARAAAHVVIVETGADRRDDVTRHAVELPAPVLMVNGRLVRADVDPDAWRTALDASETGR